MLQSQMVKYRNNNNKHVWSYDLTSYINLIIIIFVPTSKKLQARKLG